MKKIFILAFSVLLLSGAAHAADGVVFIDLERVFSEYYKTQLAKSRVDTQQQDIEAERQIMIDEMQLISEEVDVLKKEARDTTLTQEIRDGKRLLYEERLLELRAKQKEIEEFEARRTQQLQMQVTRMSQTIMDEIRHSVTEYARQEGYQAVIDSSSRQAVIGVFLYVHPDVDITEIMLQKLNSRRPDTVDEEELFENVFDEEVEPQAAGEASQEKAE